MSMQTAAPLFESSCKAIADWWGSNPHAPASFNDAMFVEIADGMMSLLTPFGSCGNAPEFRAAVVKVFVNVIASSMRDGTEQEVLSLAAKLRDDVYFEMMRFRRAVAEDAASGALRA